MRTNHMRHHKYFEEDDDYERDNYDLALYHRDTPGRFVLWMMASYLGAGAAMSAARLWRGEVNLRRRGRQRGAQPIVSEWVPVAVVQAAIAGLSWWATSHAWGYLVLWALPMVTILSGLSATRATLEHADPDSFPRRLMTFPSNPIERYLIGCFNFNYHAEHHRFPVVPACNLKRLHQHLFATGNVGETVIVPSYLARVRQIRRKLQRRTAVTPIN